MKKVLIFICFLFIGITNVYAGDSILKVHIDYSDEFIYELRRLPTISIIDDGENVVKSFSAWEGASDPRGEVIDIDGFNVLFDESDIYIDASGLQSGWRYEISNSPLTSAFNLAVTSGSLDGTLVDGDNEVVIFCEPITTDLIAKFDSSGDYDSAYSYHVTVSYAFSPYSQKIIPKSGKIRYHGAQTGEITLDTEHADDVYEFFVGNFLLKKDDVIVFEDTTFSTDYGIGYGFFQDYYCDSNHFDCSMIDPDVTTYIRDNFNVLGNAPSAELNNGYWNFVLSTKPLSYKIYKYPYGLDFGDKSFKLKIKAYVPSSRTNINYPVVGDHSYSIMYNNQEVGTGVAKFNSDGIAYVDISGGQIIVFNSNLEYAQTESWGRSWTICEDDCFSSGTIFEVEEIEDGMYNLINNETYCYENFANTFLINERFHDGKLTLTKNVEGDIPADLEFKFTIKLNDGVSSFPVSRVFNYTIGDEEGTISFEDSDTAIVTLKAGQSIVISGLPRGIGYSIEEENSEYTVRSENPSGVVSTDTRVLFTNSNVVQDNPNTFDGITRYIVIFSISVIGFVSLLFVYRKEIK